MKRETVIEKLQEVKDGDYSAFLDFLMNENGKDVNTAKGEAAKAKTEADSLKSQLAELQRAKEEAEQASMTQEQLLQKKLEELNRKQADLDMRSNRVVAAAKLQEAGIIGEDADKLLDRIVTADSAATEATVAALLEVFGNQRASVEAATKKAMMGDTPRPAANQGKTQAGITRETFDAMTYSQRVQLLNEQPDVYAQFTS